MENQQKLLTESPNYLNIYKDDEQGLTSAERLLGHVRRPLEIYERVSMYEVLLREDERSRLKIWKPVRSTPAM